MCFHQDPFPLPPLNLLAVTLTLKPFPTSPSFTLVHMKMFSLTTHQERQSKSTMDHYLPLVKMATSKNKKSEEMVQWVKHFPYKCKDLSLDAQN